MLLLLLAAAGAAAQGAAPTGAAKSPLPTHGTRVIDPIANSAQCPPISRYEAARRGGKLKPSLLDQLPMADMYKAVYRHVGDCVSPVIVKYGLGR